MIPSANHSIATKTFLILTISKLPPVPDPQCSILRIIKWTISRFCMTSNGQPPSFHRYSNPLGSWPLLLCFISVSTFILYRKVCFHTFDLSHVNKFLSTSLFSVVHVFLKTRSPPRNPFQISFFTFYWLLKLTHSVSVLILQPVLSSSTKNTWFTSMPDPP